MLTIPDDELRRWLAEDVPYGDLTSHALGFGNRPGRIRFEARQAMVAACSEEAGRIMGMAGADVTECVASGTGLQSGGLLLAAQGSAAAQAIVAAVRQVNSDAVVACTRKSIPGTRALSIKAILSGGAVPHRLGLSETILVFAQHREFTGDASLAAIVDRLRRRAPEKRIVVEADTLAEAVAIANAGADVVQLDKASPADVAALRRHCEGRTPRPLVAAAGGINAANAADYARAGADVLVTSAPYTARPLDVKVTMEAVE